MYGIIHAASLVLTPHVDYDSGVTAGDYDDNVAADLGMGLGVAHHHVATTYVIDRADLRGLVLHEVGPLRSGGQRRDSAGGGNNGGAIAAMLAKAQLAEMADLEAIIEDGSFSALARDLGEDELELLGAALVETELAAWMKVVARLDELAEVNGNDDGADGDDWEDDGWHGDQRLLCHAVNPEWDTTEDRDFQAFVPDGDVLTFGGVA
jgi:hypothetical protein